MHTSPLQRRLRQIGLAIGLGLVIGLTGTVARAQWIVQDSAAIGKAIEEYAKDAQRWMQTGQQYTSVLQHYADQVAFWQQQLVKLQGLNFALFTLQNQFKRIPDDYGMQDACPGLTGSLSGDITSALQSFLPDMGGDVVKQQQDLCQMIVMTKNKKYNDTVDYLQQVATASKDLERIQAIRLTLIKESPANMASNSNDAERFQNFLTTAQQQWDSNVKQDNAQIEMLLQMQSILSRRAMTGTPSIMGTVVNTLALKAAFTD